MPRHLFAAPILAMLATAASPAPVATGPLCRDSKGLFTPCPRGRNGAVVDTPVDRASAVAHRQSVEAARETRRRAHPEAPEKPGLFGVGTLCRGEKGRMTPCPR